MSVVQGLPPDSNVQRDSLRFCQVTDAAERRWTVWHAHQLPDGALPSWGCVSWSRALRQFVLTPKNDVVFDCHQLVAIGEFMEEMTDKYYQEFRGKR